MSDSDVTQMEEYMAQPMPVYCTSCEWYGGEDKLAKDNNCPQCGSNKIVEGFKHDLSTQKDKEVKE